MYYYFAMSKVKTNVKYFFSLGICCVVNNFSKYQKIQKKTPPKTKQNKKQIIAFSSQQSNPSTPPPTLPPKKEIENLIPIKKLFCFQTIFSLSKIL